MTNEEREALIAQGWTPPVAVDPDLAEAKYIAQTARAERLTRTGDAYDLEKLAFIAIKAGRALAAAEAKPGMVWVINRGLGTPDGAPILTRDEDGNFDIMRGCKFSGFGEEITHYAIITPPAEDAA